MLKKKVLFIMDSMEGGGAEKALATLLQHFDYGKYEVDLCLIQNSGVFLAEVPGEVKIIPLYKQLRSLVSKIENRIYYYLGVDFFHLIRIKSKVKRQYDTIVSIFTEC